MDKLDYIKQQLDMHREYRGRISKIAEESGVCRRTIINIMDSIYNPRYETQSRLYRYLKEKRWK